MLRKIGRFSGDIGSTFNHYCMNWSSGIDMRGAPGLSIAAWAFQRSELGAYKAHVRQHRCPRRYLSACLPSGHVLRRWPC